MRPAFVIGIVQPVKKSRREILQLEYSTRLYPQESVVIFDEVQKFPKARETIKYLVADERYDFIETSSLVSIKESVEGIVIPSEEEKIKMYRSVFNVEKLRFTQLFDMESCRETIAWMHSVS